MNIIITNIANRLRWGSQCDLARRHVRWNIYKWKNLEALWSGNGVWLAFLQSTLSVRCLHYRAWSCWMVKVHIHGVSERRHAAWWDGDHFQLCRGEFCFFGAVTGIFFVVDGVQMFDHTTYGKEKIKIGWNRTRVLPHWKRTHSPLGHERRWLLERLNVNINFLNHEEVMHGDN